MGIEQTRPRSGCFITAPDWRTLSDPHPHCGYDDEACAEEQARGRVRGRLDIALVEGVPKIHDHVHMFRVELISGLQIRAEGRMRIESGRSRTKVYRLAPSTWLLYVGAWSESERAASGWLVSRNSS